MTLRIFWRQTFALTVQKNWIILRKHYIRTILRCFLAPIAFAIFLGVAQKFLNRAHKLGIGEPTQIYELHKVFQDNLILWTDHGVEATSAEQIIQHATRSFTPAQKRRVIKKSSEEEVLLACPSNLNGRSDCFAAVTFDELPLVGINGPVIYTIRSDAGLDYINVYAHTSDAERKLLPLQWALDSAIIELQTNVSLPTPRQWPFTQLTNEEQNEKLRLGYINGIDSLIIIAFWLLFSTTIYQAAGSFASERAGMRAAHLQAMGCLRAARVVSWHISIIVPYLPAWIIASLVWRDRIFTNTPAGLVVAVTIIAGISQTSWAFFVSTPFGRSPQLAAISTTLASLVLAIVALVSGKTARFAFFFTFFFPPSFFVFARRAICQFEKALVPTVASQPDPARGFRLDALLGVAVVSTIVFPILCIWTEHVIFDSAPNFGLFDNLIRRKTRSTADLSGPNIALEVRNLKKVYRKGSVTAIEGLTLSVPSKGIFVLLGSNGSGKSTFNGIVSNMISPTSGTVTFSGGVARPPRGTIGIVPQKNVLFEELTCYQTVRLWSAIKRPAEAEMEDLVQLLVDCDLGNKIHHHSGTLSGGQKRKLQLAISLVGGSDLLLIDEATSGLDPLSRRAIWRALNAVRSERTIILTTHFLDEADLLADEIAILAAPGKLLANGPPVTLKSQLGQGYLVNITLLGGGERSQPPEVHTFLQILRQIQGFAPDAIMKQTSSLASAYTLKTTSTSVVAAVLEMLQSEKENYGILECDAHGTTLEEVFLALMAEETNSPGFGAEENSPPSPQNISSLVPPDGQDRLEGSSPTLSDSQYISPFRQALVIFRKRLLIAKKGWPTPLLALGVAVCGACIPLVLLKDRKKTCTSAPSVNGATNWYLRIYLPGYVSSGYWEFTGQQGDPVAVVDPINITRTLDIIYDTIGVGRGRTFDQYIRGNRKNLSIGGLSLDMQKRESLIAYEGSPFSVSGSVLLNLASNILSNELQNSSGFNIYTYLAIFPVKWSQETTKALKWITFFGIGLGVFLAFAALYVTKERVTAVKAMQLSNGLTPLGLHLGHLLTELPLFIGVSAIITIVFATAVNQFSGLGYLWLVIFLWAMASTLFAFCGALFLPSPLVAFASIAVYNAVMHVLYLTAYMLTLTYTKPSRTEWTINTIYFTMSLLGPMPSLTRAALVSVNLFSLLCGDEEEFDKPSTYGQMLKFGGPIVFLIGYIVLLFSVLIWVDSGFPLPLKLSFFSLLFASKEHVTNEHPKGSDVTAEEERVMAESGDPLRVLNISKRFARYATKAVDDVTFGVGRETLALLGPNGAGKTTVFNIIRGGITPDGGDVFIEGVSIHDQPTKALASLGLCPQFSAVDSKLTVREHLSIYGRLKGLDGELLVQNVDTLLNATALDTFADRAAAKLSGGNQRKLSLAIALTGNPDVLLIDEYSTGIDAATKRQMWKTLRQLAAGKAVLLTTHSLEEAVALSQRVAILAGRLLAIGTIKSLQDRYPTYEIHFSCRTPEAIQGVRKFVGQCFPDSVQADDVTTRWEVPVSEKRSLASLFTTLSQRTGDQLGFVEYTVERLTLESVFLKVIKENEFNEEASEGMAKNRFCGLF